MELYEEILFELFGDSELGRTKLEQVVHNRCYKAIEQIIEVVRNPVYDDPECFWRVEKIVDILEKSGFSCNRHDF